MIVQNHRRALFQAMRPALVRRAAQLSRSVGAELDELAGDEQHHLADVDDLGGDAAEQDTALALVQLGSEQLERIRWALQRLDDGTYGTCEDCGQDIPEERLRALPLATRCVRCQRAAEAEEPSEASGRRDERRSEAHLASVEEVVEAPNGDEEEVPFRR